MEKVNGTVYRFYNVKSIIFAPTIMSELPSKRKMKTDKCDAALSDHFLYQHFLSGITGKSFNAFYFACSYAKADYSWFMNTTSKIALHRIPDSEKTHRFREVDGINRFMKPSILMKIWSSSVMIMR